MSEPKSAATTERYERKREIILSAAQDALYRRGLKGMTLADVAAQVGLNATAVTYYFRKKEDLAAACYLAGIERLNALFADAARATTLTERLRGAFAGYLARHRRARLGEEAQVVAFGDMRALEEPHRSVLNTAFAQMVANARALFDGPELAHINRMARSARAHLLLEQIFWSTSWLHRYDVEDYPRVVTRLSDVFTYGFAPEGAAWRAELSVDLDGGARPPGADMSRDDFLIAATRLINRVGHHGASVEKISAELSVTKGSFYHHIDAKEDLVEACFQRTHDLMRSAQHRATAQSKTQWEAIQRAANGLVRFQTSAGGPLLRANAMTTLPEPLRTRVSDRMTRVVDRFAAMIADGVAEGSVRAVDPMIAAQITKVSINAIAEATSWIRGASADDMPALYVRPTLFGAASA
ncbi:MAG: TetR family transcriptional regulator [Alphaproteobacteria bacterium]|nr:TetR family transcriptional regulator [Alphaproteobacteria bacterium]